MHVRVCPECDEEYRPDIAVCADCGAELVDRWEDEGGRVVHADGTHASEPVVAEEPPLDLIPLFSGMHNDLKPLAEALASAGIPMRLRPVQGAVLSLSVAEPDAERAWEVLSPFQDRALELGLNCHVGHEEDRSFPETGYPACPACQAPLDKGAVICPDCGLELRGTEE